MNSYSVFKNDRLVLIMDGDRASVFKPDEVEVISARAVPVGTVDFPPFGAVELNLLFGTVMIV